MKTSAWGCAERVRRCVRMRQTEWTRSRGSSTSLFTGVELEAAEWLGLHCDQGSRGLGACEGCLGGSHNDGESCGGKGSLRKARWWPESSGEGNGRGGGDVVMAQRPGGDVERRQRGEGYLTGMVARGGVHRGRRGRRRDHGRARVHARTTCGCGRLKTMWPADRVGASVGVRGERGVAGYGWLTGLLGHGLAQLGLFFYLFFCLVFLYFLFLFHCKFKTILNLNFPPRANLL